MESHGHHDKLTNSNSADKRDNEKVKPEQVDAISFEIEENLRTSD